MRGSMDPSEYKNVALGLIFLKYISDKFSEKRAQLTLELKEEGLQENDINEELEIRDYYDADNIFWVPQIARWEFLHNQSKTNQIGVLIDDAMQSIEDENSTLKGVLPKEYARREINKRRLGEVFDLFSNIDFVKNDAQIDILGRVYEYFLGQFALSEGRKGGEFFTPSSVVQLLVEILQPFKGRVLDPCCGSGGMFVQSKKFIEAHNGNLDDVSIYGQESNPTTWKLAKMNLAIRGIEADLGGEFADSFHNNKHKNLQADYIISNPPFNISDWDDEGYLKSDIRWKYGIPPTQNANYAWVQHFIHHLSSNGAAGFVLANGSLSSQTNDEGKIRKTLIENDLIDCIISLPSNLFLTTTISACLWFISMNKNDEKNRDRRGEVLFIDARNFGNLINRKIRVLNLDDINSISSIYHNWKSGNNYEDEKGFCKSVKLEEILSNNSILTPGVYVGIPNNEMKDEKFEEKIKKMTQDYLNQSEKAKILTEQIKKILEEITLD